MSAAIKTNEEQKLPPVSWRFAALAALGGGALFLVVTLVYPSDIRINEVSFANNSGADWVELYNPTLSGRSLKGYYLSDDPENLTKFQIGDVIVPSHGFAVFFGARSAREPAVTLTFNIAAGETIYLTAPDGTDVVDSFTITGGENAGAIGRFPNGGPRTIPMPEPTAGAANHPARSY